MLIKYRGKQKFIFIANTKCASTSIEKSKIGETPEIKITNAPIGKHMSLEQVHERFGFVFNVIKFEEFFKFGVIRDPVDWVVSWYNYRSRAELSDPNKKNYRNYAGDMTFSGFWDSAKDQHSLNPQSQRFFSTSNPDIKVDYLIRLENLNEDLLAVKAILGLNLLNIKQRNKSQTARMSSPAVEDRVRKEIEQKYHSDYELIEGLDAFNSSSLERFSDRLPSPAHYLANLRSKLWKR